MLRRPFTEEPVSRLAAWSARFGWFALAVAALSVIVVRSGFLEIIPSLATFGAALALAVLAILCACGAAVTIWRQGLSGIGRAAFGFFVGWALLAYPMYLGYRATQLPAIADVTTSPDNPPRFDVLARLRPRDAVNYPTRNAALQRKAYPSLTPLQVLSPPKTAYDAAVSIVTKRRWVIVDARPPAPPARREGTIEAVARSPIMGFRDDIAIRVNPIGNGSQIDVRSASRFGYHDFGANASRIVALLDDIDEAASAAKPEKSEEPEKPKRPGKPQTSNR
ncbi:MAG: DUF1499 domain-containing protein [Pseudolabrys sp.]|nr:DUF1499 domain-containing protein [Pseudolabrys sp.]